MTRSRSFSFVLTMLSASVALAGVVPAACVGRERDRAPSAASEFAPLTVSIARPDFTLTDTQGRPFSFRQRTAGSLTFLFFGYTHCPDVCPVHAANIASVLRTLSIEDRRRVQVVFVTVDPQRDSAAVLRRWLDAFDPQFIGLRGSADAVSAIEASLGLAPAIAEAPDSTGAYGVGHAAPVILFSPDDTARAMYPFGTRQSDWARIIPRELRRAPAVKGVRLDHALLVLPAGSSPAALYFSVRNEGPTPDTLAGIMVDGAPQTSMHDEQQSRRPGSDRSMGVMTMMTPVSAVPLPAGGDVRFAPGGLHGMIEKLDRTLRRGDSVQVTLRLASGRPASAMARVIEYADLDTMIAPSPRR
jgi:protein SCO1/2